MPISHASTEERVFAALASPVRREVLGILRDSGPQPVSVLAERFDMARPSFSEHLRVLREAGLVSETRSGRLRLYRLEGSALYEVQEWLNPFERFWRDRLTAMREVLDTLEDTLEDTHD
ncbi:ArsR/SmtB family transcription factor [Herbidospora sp. RD11066]